MNYFKKRYVELDAMRGIAALMVTFAHFHVGSKLIETLGYYGQFGVQLFFILSGFVIFKTIHSCNGPLDFMFLRFSRLYPVYWAAIVITVFIYKKCAFLGVTLNTKQIMINASMFQFLFNVQSISDVYWTLWVEMKFYILICLLLFFKQIKNISVICMIWLIFVNINLFNKIPIFHPLYVLANPNFAHLFISGIIFYRIDQREASALDYLNLSLCMLSVFYLLSHDVALVIGIFYLFFFLFCFRKLHCLKNKVLNYFGTISYSLYLTHSVIGGSLIESLKIVGYHSPLLLFVSASFASYLVATLLTFYVEKPGLRLLRRWRVPNSSH